MQTVRTVEADGLSSFPESAFDDGRVAFLESFPSFASTSKLDVLRASEYARIDQQRHIYLDYTGGGLHAASQAQQHLELLNANVFGNPHSHNPTSLAMTELVEQARAYVLEFFNADPAEYEVVFTPNASGALRLVGEAYPFAAGDRYVLTSDNHNSVNGIREFARSRGATATYVPVVAPELRLDAEALIESLAARDPDGHNLFAFPAQSNFSGVQHSLEWVGYAQERGWDVLLDAAAFAPTNRLDLGQVQPDFVVMSFYKIFGYPTGVGALVARKRALAKLRRPWFAGGTIKIASVQGDGHYFIDGSPQFEDGTVNYLMLPAIEIGLRHIAGIGIDVIHERVACLTGWLVAQLTSLRHSNGQAMTRVLGPTTMDQRGGTITFNVLDPAGRTVNDYLVEELAYPARISLRTGCFCNPGAGEIAHGLTAQDMRPVFDQSRSMSFSELNEQMESNGKNISAVRISTGLATTFGDVYQFMRFAAGFRDRSAVDIAGSRAPRPKALHPDTA